MAWEREVLIGYAKNPLVADLPFHACNGLVLALAYSDGAYTPLPSALEGLTAEFGMGSGVTPPLEAPGLKHHDRVVQGPSRVIRNIDRHYWG